MKRCTIHYNHYIAEAVRLGSARPVGRGVGPFEGSDQQKEVLTRWTRFWPGGRGFDQLDQTLGGWGFYMPRRASGEQERRMMHCVFSRGRVTDGGCAARWVWVGFRPVGFDQFTRWIRGMWCCRRVIDRGWAARSVRAAQTFVRAAPASSPVWAARTNLFAWPVLSL